MARTRYCWRCKLDVPMLDEEEYELVRAALVIRTPDASFGERGLEKYHEITGSRKRTRTPSGTTASRC
jgi:hypothetical protein